MHTVLMHVFTDMHLVIASGMLKVIHPEEHMVAWWLVRRAMRMPELIIDGYGVVDYLSGEASLLAILAKLMWLPDELVTLATCPTTPEASQTAHPSSESDPTAS